MKHPTRSPSIWLGAAVVLATLVNWVLPTQARADDIDREPMRYSATKPDNVVSRLDQRLLTGKAQLQFDKKLGYLPALLRELQIPASSQMLVFSKTSFQRKYIGPRTPRALYFND